MGACSGIAHGRRRVGYFDNGALGGTNRKKHRLERHFSVLGNNLIENNSQPRFRDLFAVDLRFSNVPQQFGVAPNHDFSVGQNVGNQHGIYRIAGFGFLGVNRLCQFGIEDGAIFQARLSALWLASDLERR